MYYSRHPDFVGFPTREEKRTPTNDPRMRFIERAYPLPSNAEKIGDVWCLGPDTCCKLDLGPLTGTFWENGDRATGQLICPICKIRLGEPHRVRPWAIAIHALTSGCLVTSHPGATSVEYAVVEGQVAGYSRRYQRCPGCAELLLPDVANLVTHVGGHIAKGFDCRQWGYWDPELLQYIDFMFQNHPPLWIAPHDEGFWRMNPEDEYVFERSDWPKNREIAVYSVEGPSGGEEAPNTDGTLLPIAQMMPGREFIFAGKCVLCAVVAVKSDGECYLTGEYCICAVVLAVDKPVTTDTSELRVAEEIK